MALSISPEEVVDDRVAVDLVERAVDVRGGGCSGLGRLLEAAGLPLGLRLPGRGQQRVAGGALDPHYDGAGLRLNDQIRNRI